jgi:S-formylglutathione hydrolase FrmB
MAQDVKSSTPALRDGVWQFEIISPYQSGQNSVRVLLPDDIDKDKKYKVLYILPVEAAGKRRFGDGLAEVKKANVHNKHQLICVQPDFLLESWFADHPTDPRQRHESYILRALIPEIEKKFPVVPSPEGRLLLGFSKSGWGAFSLILRNPDTFGFACAWDTPWMTETLQISMKDRIATLEQLAKVSPSALAKENAAPFKEKTRLVLLGEKNFGPNWSKGEHHTPAMHKLLQDAGIKHEYDNSLNQEHTWGSGWVPPALEYLIKISKN